MGQSHKRKHHNEHVYNIYLYIIYYYNSFIAKQSKSVRRLVLLAMKKYVNVRLDG